MARSDGIKGVVVEGARAVAAESKPEAAEQLELLDVPHAGPVFMFDQAKQKEVAERERAAGRPKGAQNLLTRETRELMLRSGTHPLLAMMRWGSLSPEELATRLGIKTVDAFDRLVSLWRETAPYLVGKAVATDDAGNAMPMIQLNIGGQAIAIGPDARPPWEALNTPDIVEQYQKLEAIEDEPDQAVSHDVSSHE
jgi:hypothetical protein